MDRRRFVGAGVCGALLSPLVMIALAPSLHALIFWRFMLGLALPPIFTVVVAYIGEEWPPAQAMGVMGVYMAATSVGGKLGLGSDWVVVRLRDRSAALCGGALKSVDGIDIWPLMSGAISV